jgi:basic membrane protein A and related proteins
VFDVAGDCGFGAIAAVGTTGAWAIGIDDDLSYLGPQVLASVVKRRDQAVQLGIMEFASRQLPSGQDLQLDLASGNIGLVHINGEVPATVRARFEKVDAKLRVPRPGARLTLDRVVPRGVHMLGPEC